MNDLKFAVRQLRKNPGFAAVSVLTLALCLGANLMIFAVVDSVLLRPLPFPGSERLVTMYNSYPGIGTERVASSFPNLYSRRGAIDAFSQLAAYDIGTANVGGVDSAERKDILRVSAGFFGVLGVGPIMGRAFNEEEMTFQTHHVAMLSHAYWRQRYDADPDVLGKEVRVNGFSKIIVGVLPPGFRFLSSNPQILLPLSANGDQLGIDSLHNPACELVARLKPGATLEQAKAQIDAHNAAQGRDFPYATQVAAAGFHTKVVPLHRDHVAGIRPVLVLMQAGVLFLLLIGSVNLVNLLLVRASGRAKELAIRQSMGATRRHIIGQVLTETVLLTMMGGLCGLVVGAAGIRLLAWLGLDHLPLGANVAMEGRPAWFALLGALLVGLVVAIPIAWFNLNAQPAGALQSEPRGGTSSHGAQRLRHGFMIAQIALAFVLLAGAGLLGVSLKRAMEVPPGFRPDHVLAGHVSLLHKDYLDPSDRLLFAGQLLEEISHQPGVVAFGLANDIPVNGAASNNSKRVMTAVGQSPQSSVRPHVPNVYGVFGEYFSAMGIPLIDGRVFEKFEFRGDKRVCIVDETFARRYWASGEWIGQRVYDGPEIEVGAQPFTVVGVVGAVKQSELTERQSEGAVYFPGNLSPMGYDQLFIVTRTAQHPESFGPTLHKIVRNIDPQLPVHDLKSMGTRIADSLVARRSPALLAAVFAGVALSLAAIGTYGVLSYAVAQRRREIGVRLALGALPGAIGWHFLLIGLRLLAGGIVVGLFGAWAAGRAMQSLLFEVPSLHVATLTVTAASLGLVSLMACLLPTLRASRVDPMEALRHE